MGAYLILQVSLGHSSARKRRVVAHVMPASQYSAANSAANLWVLFLSRMGPDSVL
jgi:hypothetical protein